MNRLEAEILDCIEAIRCSRGTEQVFHKSTCSVWSLESDGDNLLVRKNGQFVAVISLEIKTSALVKSIYGLVWR